MNEAESKRLDTLIETACNGELDEALLADLESMLASDDEAVQDYVRSMATDAQLHLGPAEQVPICPLGDDDVKIVTTRSAARNRRSWGIQVAVAVVVCVLVIVSRPWWAGALRNNGGSAPGGSDPALARAAQITRCVDAVWDANSEDTATNAWLAAGGPVELKSGLAEITFESGARAILQGPVHFEVLSANRGRLTAGRLTARVPEAASGFSVETPTTTVVDIGTEFGLKVDDGGAAEIVVFQGEIDVELPLVEADRTSSVLPQSVRLTDGQSARVEQNRFRPEASVDAAGFVRSEQLRQLAEKEVLRDDFEQESIDSGKWFIKAWQPVCHVRAEQGVAELVNRGYLVTHMQFDPTQCGGVRVTGRFRVRPQDEQTGSAAVNSFTVVLRGRPRQGKNFLRASSGIEFTFYSDSPVPHIASYCDDFEVTKTRCAGHLDPKTLDWVDFEIIDDGRNLSFTARDANDPSKSSRATARVLSDQGKYNHIIFYSRETNREDIEYRALLDDVTITTGVGPCE